jgi:hypothetical protein
MNSLHELAKQCIAGQKALKNLARYVEDEYCRGILLVAAQVLQGYTNEVYFTPSKTQPTMLKVAAFVSLENVQTLVAVCRLRLELIEETFKEILEVSQPRMLQVKVQRQADEFVDLQAMVEGVLHVVEPFRPAGLTGVSSTYQGITRGLSAPTFYAEA